MTTSAIIQARTGSTRLPGKVMYPLDGRSVLEHVMTRTARANSVTNIIVATSVESQDDVVAQFARTLGAEVIRGSESSVLDRFARAVDEYGPDSIVRITGDCPLIDPATIDRVVEAVDDSGSDYASNISHRTFPRGLDVEAFTADSFETVVSAATTQSEQEHVTPYYRSNPDVFDTVNVTSNAVFEDERYLDRTDLRFTLDEADDYRLLNRIYDTIEYDDVLPIRNAIDLVDAEGLAEINESVSQKKI